MKRDNTRGAIRDPKIHEVIALVCNAIEPSGCTKVEEAIALDVLLHLLKERMSPVERREAELASAGTFTLYKAFGS